MLTTGLLSSPLVIILVETTLNLSSVLVVGMRLETMRKSWWCYCVTVCGQTCPYTVTGDPVEENKKENRNNEYYSPDL